MVLPTKYSISKDASPRRSKLGLFIALGSHILTHFIPVIHFNTSRKCQKSKGFRTFSGGIEMENLAKMS